MSSAWRRLPRPARVALAIAGGWLGLLNGTLNLRVLPYLANRRPDRLELGWTWAWSIRPDVAHVHGFHLRTQDRNVQTLLRVERGTVDFDPLKLFHREWHASEIHAEGVTFQLRQRPRSEEEKKEHEASVPPIEGLTFDVQERKPAAPAASATPRPSPSPSPNASARAREHDEETARQASMEPGTRWQFRIDHAEVTALRELWLEDYRWTGNGTANGGFFLVPKQTLQVTPTVFELPRGVLMRGASVAASPLSLTVSGEIEKMNPDRERGVAFLDFVIAKAVVDGELEDLSFLDEYLRAAKWVHVRGGRGAVRGTVELSRGLFRGGALEAKVADLGVNVLDDRVRGGATVSWKAEPGAKAGAPVTSRLQVLFDAFDIRRTGEKEPYAKGKGLRLTAESHDLSLFEPGANLAIDLHVPRAEVTDLTGWNSYIPAGTGVAIDAGTGTIDAALAWDSKTDRGRGTVNIEGHGVKSHVGDLLLAGDLAMTLVLADAKLRAREIGIDGSTLALSGVSLSGEGAPHQTADWWGKARIETGVIRPGAAHAFEGNISIEMRDSSPLDAIALARKKLSGPMARIIDDVMEVHDVSGSAKLSAGKGALFVDDLSISGHALEISARLAVENGARRSIAFVKRGPLSAAVRIDDKTHVDLIAPRARYLAWTRDWTGVVP